MVRIITDSTADFSPEQAELLGIGRVPLKAIFSDRAYLDGVEITNSEFYKKLATASELPTTSQPAPADFLPLFESARDAGDQVVVITISGALSGTVQSAEIAKDMCGYEDIFIVDSLTTTGALHLLVEHAHKLAGEGKSAAEIASVIEQLKHKSVLLVIVDTLEYLHKGGRLSKSVTAIGTLLKVKPIITLKDGKVEVVATARGAEKSMTALEDLINKSDRDESLPISWVFSGEYEASAAYRDRLPVRYTEDFRPISVGSVIGTHVGPGAFGAVFFKK